MPIETTEEYLAPPAKDRETQRLFNTLCNAELKLIENLNKKPRAGKDCNCKEETSRVRQTIDESMIRCLDCGGRTD